MRSARRATAAVLAAALWVLAGTVAITLAADPSATPAGGDVRTNPAAPGLVGDPLFAVAGVVVIGLAAALLTLLAVRLSTRR